MNRGLKMVKYDIEFVLIRNKAEMGKAIRANRKLISEILNKDES